MEWVRRIFTSYDCEVVDITYNESEESKKESKYKFTVENDFLINLYSAYCLNSLKSVKFNSDDNTIRYEYLQSHNEYYTNKKQLLEEIYFQEDASEGVFATLESHWSAESNCDGGCEESDYHAIIDAIAQEEPNEGYPFIEKTEPFSSGIYETIGANEYLLQSFNSLALLFVNLYQNPSKIMNLPESEESDLNNGFGFHEKIELVVDGISHLFYINPIDITEERAFIIEKYVFTNGDIVRTVINKNYEIKDYEL